MLHELDKISIKTYVLHDNYYIKKDTNFRFVARWVSIFITQKYYV